MKKTIVFRSFELISLCIDYIQSLHFIRWIIGNQLFKITSILLTLMKGDKVVNVGEILAKQTRWDLKFLCKLCLYLKVDLGELTEYIPPNLESK